VRELAESHRPACNGARTMFRILASTLFCLCAVLSARADVRISQIYGGGGQTGSPYASDFVEIYNSGAPLNLTGWSIQYASASGATWSLTPLPSVVLGTGEFLLVRQLEGTALPAGQTLDLPSFDASGSIGLSTTDGKVALCSTLAALVGPQPSSSAIVDFVGYGPNASWREPFVGGTSADNAPSGAPTLALLRGICGDSDTDRNASDFVLGFPTPRGRTQAASSGWSVRAACVPHFAKVGQSVRVIISASDCSGASAPSHAIAVVDASAIGGPAQALALDDGQVPDELAGDGLFTASFVVASGVNNGVKTLTIEFDDGVSAGGALAALFVKASVTPNNDDCARATVLSGAFPLVATAALSNATAEWSPVLHEASFIETMGSRRGLWYRVTGTGHTMTADTCASPLIGGSQIPDTVMMVLGGTCDGLTRVGFDDDVGVSCGTGSGVERRSRVSWCSEFGAPYFVWIAPFNSGPAGFTFTLTVVDGAPCTGAASVGVCTPWSGAANTEELEPPFGPALDDGCDSLSARFRDLFVGFPTTVARGHARGVGTSRDIDWYRFRAPLDDDLELDLNAAFTASVQVHALSAVGACTGAPPLASFVAQTRCATNSFTYPVSAGQWYAVRIEPLSAQASDVRGGVFVGASSSAYRLSMQIGDTVANDGCTGAFALDLGVTMFGSTTGATVEAANVPSDCDGPGAGTSGSFALTAPGVWYRVELPGLPGVDNATVYVETSQLDFDSRLSVFEGACGALQCVSANDDVDGSGRSMVAWRATASVPYFVLVHGAGASTGMFRIHASAESTPPNDECDAFELLPAFGGSLTGTTRGATGAPANVPLGGLTGLASCIGNGRDTSSYFDVWYAFDAPCTTSVTIDTCGAQDTIVSVHAACPDVSNSFAIAGACSDDGPVGCAPGSRVSFVAAGGSRSFIRVARKFAADDGGVFTLSLELPDFDGDGVVDCADGCPADPDKIAPGACGCGVRDDDSDGDGAPDCVDGCPLDPNKVSPGICGCGVSDADTDGDGVANCNDGCPLDPNKLSPGVCGCGVSDVDTDGDGVANCNDGCPLDPNKLSPGVCGCGVSDVDTDGDGVANCNDGCPLDPNKLLPGVCGCGVSDVDTDGDGVANCNDGCPLDPNKVSPGVCGCGVSDADTDGDGVVDCVDNCPALANNNQNDCDFDGIGDVCAIASGLATDLDLDAVPDNCEWGSFFAYCTGSTSTQGCTAVVSGAGVPSASGASTFVIHVASIDGARNGLQFYGHTGPANVPFGQAILCMNPPRQRTIVQATGGTLGSCNGALALDWNQFVAFAPDSLGLPASAGDVLWIQAWWRDPAGPNGTALGPALQFTFAP
jgi:hypothetical protein